MFSSSSSVKVSSCVRFLGVEGPAHIGSRSSKVLKYIQYIVKCNTKELLITFINGLFEIFLK